MKRILLILLVLVLLLAGFGAWIFFGSTTAFKGDKAYLYIRSDAANRKAVMDSLLKNNIVSNDWAFEKVTGQLNYWDHIKPGRYEISKGMSVIAIARMLNNGRQAPVEVVINKFRLKEELAKALGRKFEADSAAFMNFFSSRDSLAKYGVEPEAMMALVMPNTYEYFWTDRPGKVVEKFAAAWKGFWNDDRKNKAKSLGLDPVQVTTLASIVEEETTLDREKDTIASVYLNRLRIGMKLDADPTVKFAARDFAAKSVGGPMLQIESPYNTYRNKGLPPGPICTPTQVTIDKVLSPAQTSYLYFVANLQLRGHRFSSDFNEHVQKANEYRSEYGTQKMQQQGK